MWAHLTQHCAAKKQTVGAKKVLKKMPVTILTSCFQQVRFKNVSTKLQILSEPASLESICHHIK